MRCSHVETPRFTECAVGAFSAVTVHFGSSSRRQARKQENQSYEKIEFRYRYKRHAQGIHTY